MTENLRLVFEAGDVLTPADTNVSTNTTVTLATQPASQPSTNYYNWGTGTDDQYASSTPEVANRWLSRDSGKYESDTNRGNLTGENQYLGTFYNWYAATAGAGTSDLTSTYVRYSICPANWILPHGNGSTGYTKKSYLHLFISTYGLITQSESDAQTIAENRWVEIANKMNAFPFSLPLWSFISYSSGTTYDYARGAGYWLTSQVGGQPNNLALKIYGGSTLDISVSRGFTKSAGGNIRCVAK